jgi:hypothetical protein
MSFDVPYGDSATGEAVRLLRGSRLITDWESRYPSAEALAPLEKRRESRVAARLLELSKTFGLASREMSLVAVVKRAGDRPGELPETRVVPVGMPQDTAFSAYFDQPACYRGPAKQIVYSESSRQSILSGVNQLADAIKLTKGASARFSRSPLLSRRSKLPLATSAATTTDKIDLIDLAAMLEPDGGMPGDSVAVRAGRTIAAVFAFVAEGHTLTTGAFRLHVTRLVGFLKSLSVTSDREGRLIEASLDAASTGRAPDAQWLSLAREPGTRWKQIEAALS